MDILWWIESLQIVHKIDDYITTSLPKMGHKSVSNISEFS